MVLLDTQTVFQTVKLVKALSAILAIRACLIQKHLIIILADMTVLKTEIGKKEFTHEYTEIRISFEL